MLPSKFNKTLWIKRGGYLLIEEGQGALQEQVGTYILLSFLFLLEWALHNCLIFLRHPPFIVSSIPVSEGVNDGLVFIGADTYAMTFGPVGFFF